MPKRHREGDELRNEYNKAMSSIMEWYDGLSNNKEQLLENWYYCSKCKKTMKAEPDDISEDGTVVKCRCGNIVPLGLL